MSVKISVITPSFNQAQFLEETLRSVLSQRGHIHEYFVVDGGSTDGSADLIARYADKGIDWWVSEKDKGQSDAIQKGFSRATGDVLCWLNSDDVFLPAALGKVGAAFAQHTEWDVLTGYSVWIDGESRIERFNRIPGESVGWLQWGVHHVCQQTCFFKHDLYRRVGGLNLSLHCVMDTDLWFRFHEAGARWGHIGDYIAGFRHHEAAKGSSWLKEYAREGEWLAERYPRYHGDSAKRRIGQGAYRISQIMSGRYLRMMNETRRMRGRKVTDVFGSWSLPGHT